tara:strand:+ start:44 stop:2011 length:1968 start_codon:yes stop_codon:yes gene_type:complete
MTKTYYITTPIYYPNSIPHIGHAYTDFVTDTLARWKSLNRFETFFLTGVDENSNHVKKAADKEGIDPIKFIDKYAHIFTDFGKKLKITNNDFIRTSSDKHKQVAKSIFKKVFDKGDIYKGFYEGFFCDKCNTYYTEKDITDEKMCPTHKTPLQVLREEAYFFRMSKYHKELLKHIEENPNFIYPEFRKNEILSRLNKGLRDLCVSRSTIDWGIHLPNDPEHVIYVWFDALINYVSGIDYPNKLFKKFWPADVHIIGKDILWFHTVIWPTMLIAADIKLPKQVYAHGFINDKDGEKMSKTKGNVIDPIEMINKYSADVLRYYLLRSISVGQDGNFSEHDLIQRYNTELGNELGNLVMRITALLKKGFDLTIPKSKSEELFKTKEIITEINKFMDKFEFNNSLDLIWRLIKQTNKYINDKEPWKIEDEEELSKVIYTTTDALRLINLLLYPFLPETAEKIKQQFNFPELNIKDFKWNLTTSGKVTESKPLFPKIEKPEQKQKPIFPLSLKVGKILSVENHPGADKLYVMKVLTDHEITLVAGIREMYTKEELQDKNIIVVSNLKPAKLRGVKSEGMLLVALESEDSKNGELLTTDAKPGSVVEVQGYDNKKSRVEYKDFVKIKLSVKDYKVYYNDIQLKIGKNNIYTTKIKESNVIE